MISTSDLIGIPFKPGGKDHAGIDCYHLAQEVFKRYQIYIPDYITACSIVYHSGLESDEIDKAIAVGRKDWTRIEKPQEPCLVVIQSDRDNPLLSSHVGVYLGEDKFIHVMIKRNVCIEKLSSPLWKNKIEGFYTYNG